MFIPICVFDAATYYGVPPLLIESIISVESNGYSDAVNFNRNGTMDIGLMQINSIWESELKRFNINSVDLFDPCINGMVGAWILRNNFLKTGSWKDAIAAYNAGIYGMINGRNYSERVIKVWIKKLKDRSHEENGSVSCYFDCHGDEGAG